jgi:copper chaperone CopZ
MRAKNLGLGSALIASACCVGPALLAFVGLASFGGGVFSRYHWYFLAVGLVGVSLAWWQFQREKRKLHALAAQMRNERVTRSILLVSTAAIALVFALNAYPVFARRLDSRASAAAGRNLSANSAPVQAYSSIVFPVSGMDCPICAVPIKARLKELPGVSNVNVDTVKGTVSVKYDPSKVKPDQMAAAISSTGYKATLPPQ